MKRLIVLFVVLASLFSVGSAFAGQNTLTWTDNSAGDGQELMFEIERKSQAVTTAPTAVDCATVTGTYAALATTASDVATYRDAAAAAGSIHCYRVRAANATGKSAYSNEAGRYVPFVLPGAPSGLTIGP